MLRIRNPWGHGEWSLKWSESEGESGKLFKHAENIDQYFEEETQRCAELNIEPPERYDPRSNQNDGTFLMCYRDWRSVFSNLFLCVNFPDDYRGYRFSGQWEEGYNYGAPKASEDSKREFAVGNHQYIIQVNRNCKTELYISLGQDEGRLYKGEEYPYQRVINSILLCVFKLDSNEQKLQKFDAKKLIASSDKINLRREVDTGQFQVENGTYAVIPCAKNKGDVGHFTLNIYHNQQQKSGIKISQIKDGRMEILDIKNKDYWIMEEEEDVELFECSKDLVKLMVTEVRI
ncbi:Peptidase C2, calpain, large subunit, domain III [Pseudocohnilembus persalinus]|uniref:Peptidase C2, calpain, large subunit, domain III n=1 Tax=Pseudocohnilembus persalinus TaxID=266149 RepID=A0A0V0QJS7_PSEPJ|nr:Peptidase C2, calpain, large subunit, domain III [Pseudocohnilembus persalinus]|eukprot:KRX02563.1 Peptidase C2, calpain, large subunit, domain III [Pseudocohnilembus persalinus]